MQYTTVLQQVEVGHILIQNQRGLKSYTTITRVDAIEGNSDKEHRLIYTI